MLYLFILFNNIAWNQKPNPRKSSSPSCKISYSNPLLTQPHPRRLIPPANHLLMSQPIINIKTLRIFARFSPAAPKNCSSFCLPAPQRKSKNHIIIITKTKLRSSLISSVQPRTLHCHWTAALQFTSSTSPKYGMIDVEIMGSLKKLKHKKNILCWSINVKTLGVTYVSCEEEFMLDPNEEIIGIFKE